MTTPPFLTAPNLTSDKIAHGFFGREGGVSAGIFASLNVGIGSTDMPEHVQENRERVRKALGADHLATLYQCHTADVITITAPLTERPQADAMVTKTRGIAIGVLAADCVPILFADHEAGVIGAAHAGWKGALGGIPQNTVLAMEALGATRANIRAAIGPSIKVKSYEVGADFPAPFIAQDAGNARFFTAKDNGHYMFDLPGYVMANLQNMGVDVTHLNEDTYSQPARYFSYRLKTHQNEPDYGRQISAISLK